MAEAVKLKVGDSPEAPLKEFLKALLEKGVVKAVMCSRPMSSGAVSYALMANADEVEASSPLAPCMPVNAAAVVSDMTKVEPFDEPVAAVLRPCEARALVELVKLKQASLENLLIVALDCYGTVSFSDFKELGNGALILAEGADKLRPACTVCEFPVSPVADVEVALIGADPKSEIFLLGKTGKGQEALEKASVGEAGAPVGRDEAVEALKKKRLEALEKFVSESQGGIAGWDNLLAHFADCINCHNCKMLCPVCYCRQCFFDSDTLEVEGRRHLGAAARRGSVRLPDDTLLFHITRMNHMGLSCVGCGLCSDACPNDVDVFKAFRTVAHNAQREFDYVPGRSVEEELPQAVYKEDEFQTVGE